MYKFCVVFISFYKKMTIKPLYDVMYGSNNLIIILHLSGRLTHSRGKTPFWVGQNALCPTDSD